MKMVTLYLPASLEEAFDNADFLVGPFSGDAPAPVPACLNYRPTVDVVVTQNSYLLKAELPGYTKNDVKIQRDGTVLTISSKKDENEEKKMEVYILQERKDEPFRRSFKLPKNADMNSISVSSKNGILTIRIMKEGRCFPKNMLSRFKKLSVVN